MKIRVYFMLLGFAIFTGATFNLAKYSIHYFSAAAAAGWRFGIAAVLMIGILAMKRSIKWQTIREYGGLYLLLGLIGVFGFNAFFFLGMKYTSPLNGALIMAANPLVTTILSFLILKTPITRRQLAGISFALLGVILVLTKGSWDLFVTHPLSIGDAFILLGNICWALYGVLGRKYLRKSSSIETTTYTMFVGAVLLIIMASFIPGPLPLSKVVVSAWGAILFMAVFTSVLGYLWWNKGMEAIGAGQTSVFFNLVPVVTMVISFITGTSVSFVQIVGTMFVILGVLMSSGLIQLKKKYEVTSQM